MVLSGVAFSGFVEDTFDIQKWFKAMKEKWGQDLEQEKLFSIGF